MSEETVSGEKADEEAVPAVDDARDAAVAAITEALGDGVVETHVDPGQDVWIRVANASWQDAAAAAKAAGYNYFSYVSAIDWMIAPEGRYEDTEFDDPIEENENTTKLPEGSGVAGGDTRFQVLARVESPTQHIGITFKADLADDMTIGTWSDIFPGADWHEREAWEMYGVTFAGHPGLRKIYLPGDFEGNPLRKDFPLLARTVKPWPGVVDIEEIPEQLEAQLEAEVMAAFEAENPSPEGSA